MRFPDLARTFKDLADKGKPGFYAGRVAAAIVDLIADKGGVMTLQDLADHESTEVDPISYEFEGVTIFEVS